MLRGREGGHPVCLFIGVLFLVGLPISVASGTFTGDPVLFGMMWLGGVLALGLRVRQAARR